MMSFSIHRGVALAASIVLLCAGASVSAQPIPSNVQFRIASDYSGLCWDVAGPFRAGTPVQQYPCHTGDNQMWTIESAPPGGFLIVSANRSLCVGLAPPPSRQLAIQNCTPPSVGSARVWDFVRTDRSGRPCSINQIKLMPATSPGDCIDVTRASLTPVELQLFGCHNGADQTWLLLPPPEHHC
jgi:hypothetical protein